MRVLGEGVLLGSVVQGNPGTDDSWAPTAGRVHTGWVG